MVVVVARGWLGRGQTKSVVQEEVHLLPHFIDRGLRAQGGRVGETFALVTTAETQGTQKAVHIRLFKWLGLTLRWVQ